jgi:outer membrane biosynthesis protein TonB
LSLGNKGQRHNFAIVRTAAQLSYADKGSKVPGGVYQSLWGRPNVNTATRAIIFVIILAAVVAGIVWFYSPATEQATTPAPATEEPASAPSRPAEPEPPAAEAPPAEAPPAEPPAVEPPPAEPAPAPETPAETPPATETPPGP